MSEFTAARVFSTDVTDARFPSSLYVLEPAMSRAKATNEHLGARRVINLDVCNAHCQSRALLTRAAAALYSIKCITDSRRKLASTRDLHVCQFVSILPVHVDPPSLTLAVSSPISHVSLIYFLCPRRLCRSAWVGRSRPSVCLFVCLSAT